MEPMRIGIKYCGGCNPYYDRVGAVEEMKSRLRDRFLFLRYDEKDLAGLIAVSGCSRACATKELEAYSVPWYSVTEKNDLGNLLEWLSAFRRDRGRTPT